MRGQWTDRSLNCSMLYRRQNPPCCPQWAFHTIQVESITFPKMIGEGIYPNKRNITNCIPKARDRSSSSTDLYMNFEITEGYMEYYLKVIISNGICVIETTNVMTNSRIMKGIIAWHTWGQGPAVANGIAVTSWSFKYLLVSEIQAQLL